MMGSTAFWGAAAVLLVVALGGLAGSGLVPGELIVMAVLWVTTAYLLGRFAARPEDEGWLARTAALAVAVKALGSTARYFVLFTVYQGGGDATGYHNAGLRLADIWRSFNVPDPALAGTGGEATKFVKVVTGLLYAPFEPTALGGFWIFGLVAFIGQFFLYLAFRRACPPSTWRRYAVMVFFWPTLIYWPSSPGKEAVIMFALGIGAWAASHLYGRYQLRWIPVLAAMAWFIGMVRIHVAALVAGSAVAGVLLSRWPRRVDVALRKNTILVVGVALLIPLIIGVGDQFGVAIGTSLSADDLEPVLSSVEDQTGQGGSAVSGGAIRSVTEVPAGVLKVVFRPLPNEAGNVQSLAASVEGVLLLLLISWRLPNLATNWRRIRQSPYLVFCLIYSALFVWAWSAISNLGIMARQRSLLLPFLLALVAALGWDRSVGEPGHVTDPSTPEGVSGSAPQKAAHAGPGTQTNAPHR